MKPSYEKQLLKSECLRAFDCTCQYCHGKGDWLNGPDGRSWHLDRRWPGVMGHGYTPDNVTLACCFCNCQKVGSPPTDDPRWDVAMSLEECQVLITRQGRHYDAWEARR